ncbi:MAG TPA: zf-HC2 domain-containing protein [Thermoanaerobaculia bacterium]|nr:zf-HC2 domain-containing protein [Thermoanaerobaculia bacterium]
MSAAATTEHGLSDEMLAAFVDGKLSETERAAVIKHLASCDECRVNASYASEIADMLEVEIPQAAGNVAQFPVRKNRWMWIAGSAAAAALIAAMLVGPMRDSVFDEPGIPKLVKASESLTERKLDGRLMGGFSYKVRARTFRGEDGTSIEPDELPLLQAFGEISNAAKPDLHARAAGLLLTGQRTEAVKAFREALAKGAGDRTVVENDLGVALLASGADADLKEAFEIFERAWARAKTPETAWNRAYALQRLYRDKEAIAAWNDYLKLDPSSQWAKEATEQRDRLQADLQQP